MIVAAGALVQDSDRLPSWSLNSLKPAEEDPYES